MKISMCADFLILKNVGNGEFVPMDESEFEDISFGGYSFQVGDRTVPFDWEDYEVGCDAEGFWSVSTGYGWLHKNFELDNCYDEDYARMGLAREDITAEFLASVHHIDDFYVDFVSVDGKECEAGSWHANGHVNAPYRLKLLKVGFEDVDGDRYYEVDSGVLEAFNKGERLMGLESMDRVISKSADGLDTSRGMSVEPEVDFELE